MFTLQGLLWSALMMPIIGTPKSRIRARKITEESLLKLVTTQTISALKQRTSLSNKYMPPALNQLQISPPACLSLCSPLGSSHATQRHLSNAISNVFYLWDLLQYLVTMTLLPCFARPSSVAAFEHLGQWSWIPDKWL
jgi:hypothetical protein